MNNRRSAAIYLWMSELLLLSGALVICTASLFWLRGMLSSRQLVDRHYLFSAPVAGVAPSLFLSGTMGSAQEGSEGANFQEPISEMGIPSIAPGAPIIVTGVEAPEITEIEAPILAEAETPVETEPEAPAEAGPNVPALTTSGVILGSPEAALGQMFLPLIVSQPVEQVVVPAPPPVVTGPVVRLVIPSLQIDRAVVPITVRMSGGTVEWDTDKLFATRNRLDLVGQPEISTNPAEGGNVILVGHNYDNGVFIWEGVFVDIKSIQPGAEISLYTEGGGQFRYVVQQVKKVSWSSKSAEELERHARFLGPQPDETLTLVTCGGANIWPWPARIYVVAKPVQ